jgi:peptidyl-prolyl cis-trans isomerase C
MKIAAFSVAATLAAALTVAGSIHATAQSETDPVLARVDGTEIRLSDIAMAEEDIGSGLQPSPPEVRRETLLTYLIDVALIAKAAEEQKLAEAPGFARQLAYARQKVLMQALLEKESKSATSEEAMKKVYDESVAQNKPVEEVHARHILVETEDKAKEILAKLKAGGDFAELAKEESKDPGSADGGSLGYFTQEQMVPEFADVAFKLEKGALSEPVQTQFGWHIIKVEDRRNKPVPSFEQVKDQIQSFVVRRAQAELVGKLREAGKVERIPLKSEAPADPAGAEPKK